MSAQLPTPTEFPAFPFNPPYPIQVDLMRHLYSAIEQSNVAIAESPTGTGKTLSLLCASLTWLHDNKDRTRRIAAGKLGDPTDWVAVQAYARRLRDLEANDEDYAKSLSNARKRENEMKRIGDARITKKIRQSRLEEDARPDGDHIFLPETDATVENNTAVGVRELMKKRALLFVAVAIRIPSHIKAFNRFERMRQRGPPIVNHACTKVYYASRTHSQLTQIFGELDRLKFRTSQSHVLEGYPRTVALASRRQLCINDELRTRSTDLDSDCLELMQAENGKRCPYLPPIGEDTQMMDFRDQILATPKDIEELVTAGRLAHTCPYFGSRQAIPQAELVTLPYNLLLHKSAREAMGIDLTDQIVIVDEAHNLIPTLLSISTICISARNLANSSDQMSEYLSRFQPRLQANHTVYLKQLILFLDALKTYSQDLKAATATTPQKTKIVTCAELMQQLGRKVESLNLVEIAAYLHNSKIAKKIKKYFHNTTGRTLSQTPFHLIEEFITALVAENEDGRISFSFDNMVDEENPMIKYQLLNPATNFQEVVKCARSIILAGGTMSPISEIITQLFRDLNPQMLSVFSCDHIIPSTSLLAIGVGKGPSGYDLKITYEAQQDDKMVAEIGQILHNLVRVIPKGMIVFLPSYRFLDALRAGWCKSQLLEKIAVRKQIFFEPECSQDVEAILQAYALAIHNNLDKEKVKGAILFAVIGAKLSEGLNFSDDLARAIVIIGLPYPNLGSTELQERLKYVDRLEKKRTVGNSNGRKTAALELYENMCMNAVNQSIGRAIRHKEDWASLILIDYRYSSPNIQNKLPKWIANRIVTPGNFGYVMKDLSLFYQFKKNAV